MAFVTLNALRALLNTELGRTDASTQPWGTDTDCNTYIQQAIRAMWPVMARLVKETVTPTVDTMDYTLTSVVDIVQIEQLNSSGLFYAKLPSWREYYDESAATDVPVRRIMVPELATDISLRVVGYQPYAVPATGTDTCDVPSTKLHVVIAGARVEAYRRRLNEYVDFKTRAAANPVTNVQQNEIERIYLAAKAEFEELKRANGRQFTSGRRAKLSIT